VAAPVACRRHPSFMAHLLPHKINGTIAPTATSHLDYQQRDWYLSIRMTTCFL
jgi:hypothetical protein